MRSEPEASLYRQMTQSGRVSKYGPSDAVFVSWLTPTRKRYSGGKQNKRHLRNPEEGAGLIWKLVAPIFSIRAFRGLLVKVNVLFSFTLKDLIDFTCKLGFKK